MDRPAVAIIANSCPPYRLHLHMRLIDEIPQVKFFSVFTHEISSQEWEFDPPGQINPVNFGRGEPAHWQGKLRHAGHEWRKGGRIIRWMEKEHVRAVVLAGYNDPGRLRIIRWCHCNRIPLLLHADSNIRDDTSVGLRSWLKRLVVGQVMRWTERALPFGRRGREYFMKYGMAADRIVFVPLEPDYSLIQGLSGETIEEARAQFGLSMERRRIIYSGRMVSIKRVDLLLDAFAAIADERPEWDLLLVGDGPLRPSLQQRVPARLGNRIVWTGFLHDQAVISALYRLSDMLVLPSDREPWALVVNEATAAGLAIVASDAVGAAPELVRDGVNGRVFRRGDLQHLIECLKDATDPRKVDAMKSVSFKVLQDWRTAADPVAGLRQALRPFGLIGDSSQ